MVTPIGEELYYDDDDEGHYVENDHQKDPESPDTFFFVQSPTTPSQSQSQSQAQAPSPAQAYAQTYVETHRHNHEGRQPLTSDSSQTPPSPIPKPVLNRRRSSQRPSLANHHSPTFKRTSNAHTAGHNSNATANPNIKDRKNINNASINDKRTQSLNALPPQTLIHLLQIKEEERKRAKGLLKSALVQLEMEVERGEVLGSRVKELEAKVERERAEKERGGGLDVNTLKEMLAEQRGRISGGAEMEGLKLKLSNTEKELQRIKEDFRALQIERDDSDRALVRARTLAREMKEKAILIQAREQGRQEGFEEGLRQGRVLGEESSGEASGSGGTRSRRSRERSTHRKSSSRRNRNTARTDAGPSQASLEAEASIAAIRSISERENERVQLQLKAMERELNAEKERMKDVEREKGQLEKVVREERRRRDEREREKDRERIREREAREAKEREMRDALKKEVEERERVKRQMEQEKENVREQMEKEKQDIEKKLAEANKDKEKFEKQLKKEKEKSAPLPYLAMARPPSASSRVPEVSRTSSSESYRRQQPRRSSVDSYTSQASTIPIDIVQLPPDRRGDLDVIHEVPSPSATNSVVGSATAAAPPPPWFTNPPVDYSRRQNDGGMNRAAPDLRWPQEPTNNHNPSSGPYPPYNPQHGNQPNYLTPPENNVQSSRRSTGSTGSYEFIIVPPSRPESVVGGGDPESTHTYNAHYTYHPHNSNTTDDPQFLSPNHRPIQLPQTQTRAESPAATPIPPRHATPHPRGDTSGLPTRPNTPAGGFMGTIDANSGSLPPGFIPQIITDARGRSTPIIGGGGFIPPSPGGSGGLGGPATPNSQWTKPVIPPTSSSGPAPIYGNPVTLERDKKREEAAGYPATPATPRSQSPVGADWSAPLAALHPPIFPITGHQQPFQHPPPGAAGGTWLAGTSNDRSHKPSFEHSPVSSTRPVIPGQTSTLGSSGSGGGGGWGAAPLPRGFGGGMTPGARNQELSPVIPTRPLSGGAWGSSNRPSGASSTPAPRNQGLPPVIPNPTLRGGSAAWGTASRPPSGFGTGGATPGSRNQDLPPVIPNSTLGGGGWNSPNRPPGSFGAGGMTPASRSQDLPPVIPNSTLSGGPWGTPSRPPGSFGGGATPGTRNQDLPPVIPNPTLGGAGGWNTPNRPPGSFGAGGTTPGPRNQDLPPVIPNSTLSAGPWGTPNRPPGNFGAGGMTPRTINQDLPSGSGGGSGSPYQPSFSIYAPPTNGGHSSPFLAPRSTSPFPNGEEDVEREDDDPITAQNTKMNAANLGVDAGSSMTTGGARGGKAGKKGKKKRN